MINCVFGLIACVCFFTFRLVNFGTGRTNFEKMSARWTKASMNVEDCVQRSILQ